MKILSSGLGPLLVLFSFHNAQAEVLWYADPEKPHTAAFNHIGDGGSGSGCSANSGNLPVISNPIDETHGKVWKLLKPQKRKRGEFGGTKGLTFQEGKEYYLGWRWKITSSPAVKNNIAVFQWKSSTGNNQYPSTQNYPFGMGYDGKYLRLNCYGSGGSHWSTSSPTTRRTTIWRKEIPEDTWMTLLIRVKVSRDDKVGFVEFWYNGTKQTLTNMEFQKYKVNLSDNNTRAWHKTWDATNCDARWGSYNTESCAYAVSTYFDEMRIASAYEEAEVTTRPSSLLHSGSMGTGVTRRGNHYRITPGNYPARLETSDLTGRKIATYENIRGPMELMTESLSPGITILRITSPQDNRTYKLRN